MAAFGFSAGDFVNAIGLITAVSKALKDTDGATWEYQQFDIELQSLRRILGHLQAMKPTAENIEHVNAIRALALTCRLPLDHFLARIDKFKRSLGPTSSSSTLKRLNRKAQWALLMNEELPKLRAHVTAKVVSLNLLMTLQSSTLLEKVESMTSKMLPWVLTRLETMSLDQERLKDSIRHQSDTMERSAQGQAQVYTQLKESLANTNEAMAGLQAEVSSSVFAISTIKHTWLQLANMLQSLPRDLLEIVRTLARTNLEIYNILRSIQASLRREPNFVAIHNILFEDALGRSQILPYDFFKYFEVFDRFLQHRFKGLPGESRVSQGEYMVIDAQLNGLEIAERNWSDVVQPGSKLIMSIILDHILRQGLGLCPRLGCTGNMKDQTDGFRQCSNCTFKVSNARSTNPINIRDSETQQNETYNKRNLFNSDHSETKIDREKSEAHKTGWATIYKDEDFSFNDRECDEIRAGLKSFKRITLRDSGVIDYSTRPLVFMDIDWPGRVSGRIIIQLFLDFNPQLAQTFLRSCTGEGSDCNENTWLYKGSTFHTPLMLYSLGNTLPYAWENGCFQYQLDNLYDTWNYTQTIQAKQVGMMGPFQVAVDQVMPNQYGAEFCVSTKTVIRRAVKLAVIGQVIHGRSIIRQLAKPLRIPNPPSQGVIKDCGLFEDEILFRLPKDPVNDLLERANRYDRQYSYLDIDDDDDLDE